MFVDRIPVLITIKGYGITNIQYLMVSGIIVVPLFSQLF